MISRLGFSDFTLADVARACGIAPATLLQRFGGKQGLIVAVVAHENDRLAQIVAQAPRAVGAEAVIDLFWGLTPAQAEGALADELSGWTLDPQLNALARERSAMVRAAVAERLPPLAIDAATAARLLEAQWRGALVQWSIERQGDRADHVADSLAAWFELARPRAVT